jgi:hypothetical protein
MNGAQILQLRLQNTGLIRSSFKTPGQAVSRLGAVQAQDYAAAKWALGMRVKNSTEESIDKAFNSGSILRTHVMRPTWHFVMPQDIRWMLELTAPRVKSTLASYHGKLNLDDALYKKSNNAIVKALRNHTYLTRQELKKILEGIGIKTDVQRLAHIIAWAELDQLICSGPRRGKQFTYALLEERVPKVKKLQREEALSKLAWSYFRSHGPAQLLDFTWWSGLAAKDARAALDLIQDRLEQTTLDGKTYWFSSDKNSLPSKRTTGFLLSIYDEYTIAYKDRGLLSEARDVERMITMGNALTAVMILNGKVAGTWKKSVKKNKIEVQLQPFQKLNKRDETLLKSEISRYRKFFINSPVI